jgi:hypothetical protein
MTEANPLSHLRKLLNCRRTNKEADPKHLHNLLVTDEHGHGGQDGLSFALAASGKGANKSGQNALAAMVYFATQPDQLDVAKYKEALATSDAFEDKENLTLSDAYFTKKVAQLQQKGEKLIEQISGRTSPMTKANVQDYIQKATALAEEMWHGIKPEMIVEQTPDNVTMEWRGRFTKDRTAKLSIAMENDRPAGAALEWNAGTKDGIQLTQSSFLSTHLQEALFARAAEQKAAPAQWTDAKTTARPASSTLAV